MGVAHLFVHLRSRAARDVDRDGDTCTGNLKTESRDRHCRLLASARHTLKPTSFNRSSAADEGRPEVSASDVMRGRWSGAKFESELLKSQSEKSARAFFRRRAEWLFGLLMLSTSSRRSEKSLLASLESS